MLYIPNTENQMLKCGDALYELVEDIHTDDDTIADTDYTGIICLHAEVVPMDRIPTDWVYVAHWSVSTSELPSLEAGDISNPAFFSGIVATISTPEDDDVYCINAHGERE